MAVGTAAVNSYADYEQLAGGVQTLFSETELSLEDYAKSIGKTAEEAFDEWGEMTAGARIVQNNAEKAYKTAGMSANEYMETVTSFSASLIQSLGGDTKAAAQAADQAIIDMADNANKMGSSTESIQNAYQGFAKQNYTMLDNLKLGYGGTKSEMERLLKDAEKIHEETTGEVTHYDINNLADVYSAIHDVQTELGITGTTSKEAATTISGSMNMAKAAWSNLLTGIADDSADFDSLIDAFVESVSAVAENLIPRITTVLSGIGKLIEKLLPVALDLAINILTDTLPELLQAGVDMIQALITGIQTNLPTIMDSAVDIIMLLVDSFIGMLPQLLELGLHVIVEIALGIAQALPTLIPTIIDVLLQIVDVLIQNIGLLVDAALQLIMGLTEGLIAALPVLMERLPEIVTTIVDTLILYAPELLKAASEIITALLEGLVEYLPDLLKMLPELVEDVVNTLIDNAPQLLMVALEFITTLADALGTYLPTLLACIPQLITDIINAFLNLANKFLDVGSKYIGEVKNSIETTWSSMLGSVSTWISELITKFTNSLSGFADIGSAIVDGIWSGISAGWEWLKGKVKEVAGSLFGAAKDELDINSPSRKFRWLAEMCCAGWDEGAEDLMSTDSMTKNVKANLSALQMNMAGARAFGGTTTGFGGFQQTVNIYQPISTPDEMARALRLESKYGLMRGAVYG